MKESFRLPCVDEIGVQQLLEFVDKVPTMYYDNRISSAKKFCNYFDKN